MSDKFFRFPLGLLSFKPDSPEQTLQMAVSTCLVEIAQKTYLPEGLEELRRLAVDGDIGDFEPRSAEDFAIILAARLLNVSLGNLSSPYMRFEEGQSYLGTLSEAARNNRVNIKTELLWSCNSTVTGKPVDRSLSWREFRVLSALLSKVGTSKYAKCGWQEIAARAAGWCGKSDRIKASAKELSRRKGLLLTREQIRRTLERLESDKFFARFQYRRAESWFSFSCEGDREELVKWVSNAKSRRAEQVRFQREKDAADSSVVLVRKYGNHLTTTINRKGEKPTTINGTPNLPPPDNHLTNQVATT